MLESLVENPYDMCVLSAVNYFLLTDTELVHSRGCMAVEGFLTSVATRLEQTPCTLLLLMDLYARDWRKRTELDFADGRLLTARVQLFDKMTYKSAHRVGWSVHGTATGLDTSANLVEMCTGRELIRPSIALHHPRARLEVVKSGKKKNFVLRNESGRYSLVERHLEVMLTAEESSTDFDSASDAVLVSTSISMGCMTSSSVFMATSMAGVDHSSRLYCSLSAAKDLR